jgi:putative hydrolase of the HAD superfamily
MPQWRATWQSQTCLSGKQTSEIATPLQRCALSGLAMTTSIKVVFFDAGGTLFRPYPSVGDIYARTAAKHGVRVDAETVEKAFQQKWHERNGMTTLAGLSSEKIEREWWYRLVRDVFGNLGQFDDFDVFFQELYDLFARAECWRLFNDAVPALEALKGEGYRLGIISNWDHRLFSIVEQLGLSRYFEQVVASSAVGIAKPGRRIFEAALEAMRAAPGESLHVGDSLEDDYHGASRAGLSAVLLNRDRKAYNGVVRIESLRELPDLLK